MKHAGMYVYMMQADRYVSSQRSPTSHHFNRRNRNEGEVLTATVDSWRSRLEVVASLKREAGVHEKREVVNKVCCELETTHMQVNL